MSGRARDASQFRYVEEDDLGGFWWERFRHVCTAIPAAGNHYLEWFLTSRYADLAAGPPYLRPAGADRLRPLLDRVELVVDDLSAYLEAQAPRTFSKANLSDVFEYMSGEASERLLRLVASRMRPGGRIAYWNLLVPRARPESLSTVLAPRGREAQELWAEDRVFFYRAFHVDEIIS
jgi:S-adenosylmethionine-diacylglycerol 3-amino-3-carboxypropyl transferase